MTSLTEIPQIKVHSLTCDTGKEEKRVQTSVQQYLHLELWFPRHTTTCMSSGIFATSGLNERGFYDLLTSRVIECHIESSTVYLKPTGSRV